MTMANIIQQALRPLFLICFFIGVSVYPIKQPEPRIRITYLSILYSLIFWSFYIYIIYHVAILFTLNGLFLSTMNCIVMIINIFTTIMSTFVNFYYHERLAICMTKLNAIDDSLKELGTPKTYHKLCIWSKRGIIIWLAYVFIMNAYDTYWWLGHQRSVFWALTLACVTNHCIHVNTLMDLLFIIFLWHIGNRFDKINEHVQCLLAEKELETCNRSIVTIYESTNDHKRMLWISMHIHLELCRIARELNLMFGMQMTLETASYLMYLTAFCYHILYTIMQGSFKKMSLLSWFICYMWACSLIMRLYIINYICDNVVYKANGINKTIHHLTTITRYADILKEVYQFTLQVMHYPLKFTGMGLFQFGHKFICKFYITIATFVIIMIQFKVPVNNMES
ncbi:ObirGr16 [Ooceraea biroi]|uniref:Gustatory receptor n=1 Tax=Ooceraea biroi TaxID=2015173 RepID=A0A3L8DE06_OOCBI|nr:ObirGr16 [Ooceraea biroi]